MAYFGRRPEKPGSVPGSQAGFVQQEGAERLARAVRSFVTGYRPERPGRPGRALRAVRAARSGRSAR